MARVKRALNAHKKRREVLEMASGYRGSVHACTARRRSSCSTRWPTATVTARTARATSAPCGSSGSTRRLVPTA